jgi:4-hydroxy-3-methylbut-2-enyl diphosphate reductase IspH
VIGVSYERSTRNAAQEILLAEPRGFCAGVDRAIEIVERALTKFGRPIYVRHEIVHNTYVVNDLKKKARSSLKSWTTCRPARRWCSAPTA